MTHHPTYGLIGRGRVATHMAHYLRLEEQSCTVWHRGVDCPPERSLEKCDTILLAISDDSLASFVDSQPWLGNRKTAHFSGRCVVQSVAGLHPAMTFGPDLYDLQTYRQIPFVGQSGGLVFADVFPALLNPSWEITAELKPLYHALCVLGGNGIAGLAAMVLDQFEHRLGLPPDVLKPLLEQSLGNGIAHGLPSMTGPWIRGDSGTVASNLAALRENPLCNVYQACRRAIETNEVRR